VRSGPQYTVGSSIDYAPASSRFKSRGAKGVFGASSPRDFPSAEEHGKAVLSSLQSCGHGSSRTRGRKHR
jgi:hypothetical protein